MNAVSVRAATIEDAPALALLVAALRAHQNDPIGDLNEAAIRRDGFGEAPEFSILIAERERRPIGYALYTKTYEPAFAAKGVYLADLYVRPEARRSGAGRALVQAVAAEARRHERRFVWWTSLSTNTEAHAFYAALGAITHGLQAHVLGLDAFGRLADAHSGSEAGPASA